MSRRFFGTDGVRGPYGGPVMNEVFARRLGAAVARWLGQRGMGGAPVPLGRDTRASGFALERALAAGLASGGMRPLSLGVVPTPAVALRVRESGAPAGGVVTASHNPAADNGLKFFGAGGIKLSEADEAAIEACLPEGAPPGAGFTLGEDAGAAAAYRALASAQLVPGALAGWRIAVDCAHGATCGTTPAVLEALGAEVRAIGVDPDGGNINAGVGSEHPAALAGAVRDSRARLGVAHDGDGDRCVLCDETGLPLDGDEILTLLAADALERGTLPGGVLVVTQQSNLGVDTAVAARGGRVVRTPVGDRHVIARMRAEGAQLGGESSGHIVCGDVSPTGDGLIATLRVLEVMRRTGRPLSDLRGALRRFPQRTAALRVRARPPLGELRELSAALLRAERDLGPQGRVLARYSGTEPLLRLLVEGPDEAVVAATLPALHAAALRDGLAADE